ncbi:endonuclease [Cylindrospermum sp. FACHB-282]|uniref:endonuclease n=1 Tax=Cylindrospermum sp. FACHB-282 TaxID=2692794 RepID=UPI00168A38B6|nr:endonuclease [Cylindrospermum sp. FACHB-282]MBD2387568.1 endonuclease [Cylindrospermum sp. FACHB-282]
MSKEGIYNAIITGIFNRYYQPNLDNFEFNRDELPEIANQLGIQPPKNLGDLLYCFRYRRPLPKAITDKVPEGMEWIIESKGSSNYSFRLVQMNRIIPNKNLIKIKIPDASPEIIDKYMSGDEQALLTKIRYNRLIDIFLGITAYSLQNHLRTTVTGVGQIEIDEIYVAINSNGVQFIIPVQAKAGNDQIGVVQTKQDIGYCTEKFPDLICRSISAQFMEKNLIAMFELAIEEGEVKIVQEKHFNLVPAEQISEADLKNYRNYE